MPSPDALTRVDLSPPGRGIPAPYPARDPGSAAPSGRTAYEPCSSFVLDFGPKLGYIGVVLAR